MEIANIGSEGLENRLRRSVYAFGLTLLFAVALRFWAAPGWAFALLFIPFWGAFLLVYQGLFKT